MVNSKVMLICPALDAKYAFWTNLVQKFKTVSLSWKLVPRIIQKCWIRGWFSLKLILTKKKYLEFDDDIQTFSYGSEISFLVKLGSKKSKLFA